MTMPQSTGQVPIYYNHLSTGRPVREGATQYYKYQSNYLDVRNDPLYPSDMELRIPDLHMESHISAPSQCVPMAA